jgi:site-specific DNA recombinase
MQRAVIYARYSTDLQDERSIDDQITLCRTFAEREDLTVVREYSDAARSGASMHGRSGLLDLMADAKHGAFDVVLVEALDRISRDMEDLAGIHKRLSFMGIEIRALHDGQVTSVLVGLRGLVGQLFREDNAKKVRRGLAGRIKQGLSAGGRSYGYRPDPMNKGKLIIVPEEAAVVLRIFESFDAGKSPRTIAGELNEEGIPPPRGTKWNASTINGSAGRCNGTLRNPLYNGVMVWNRVRMPHAPDTGRRVPRVNPNDQWDASAVPEYRIIPADLFERVQRTKKDKANEPPGKQQKPKRLLSGLLRCGACGSGMSVFGKDRSRRVRIRCSAHRESGSCPDPKTFYLDVVEEVVVNSLLCNLHDPEVVTAYVQEYLAERTRLAAEAVNRRSALERKIAVQQREIDRIVDAVAKGLMEAEEIGDRIKLAKVVRNQLKEELASVDPVDNVVTLHPAALKRFKDQMLELREALGGDFTSHDVRGAAALRSIVRSVTVFRDENKRGGARVEVQGHLNALLKFNPGGIFVSEPATRTGSLVRVLAEPSLSGGKVVAEEGLEPPTQGL